jgi:hypothetical protein
MIPQLLISIELDMSNLFVNMLQNFVVKPFNVLSIVLHFIFGHFTGLTETDDQRRRQSSWPESSFLATSIDQGLNPYSGFSSDVKCANTFGPIKFMSTDTHEIDFGLVHINGNLSNCLGSICVEKDASLSAKFSNFINILNDADLVVNIDCTDT